MTQSLAAWQIEGILPFGHLEGSNLATLYEDTETITNENTLEGKIPRFAGGLLHQTQIAKGGRADHDI